MSNALRELELRRNTVLSKMVVLAEGPTARLDPSAGGKKPKASASAPRDFDSLYDHWRTEFDEDWPAVPDDPDEAALDWCIDRALKLVLRAERDYGLRTGSLSRIPANDSRERDKFIVKHYEGYEPEAVAILERCSVSSVRNVRRTHGRNATTGRR